MSHRASVPFSRSISLGAAVAALLLAGCHSRVKVEPAKGVSATNSTIVVAPASTIVADGLATATVTVTVRDAKDRPMPDLIVQLASTGSDNVVVQPANATDSNGEATGTIASTTAEAKTVVAVVDPGPDQVVLVLTPGAQFVGDASNLSAQASTVTVSPGADVVADGVVSATVTVTVRDVNGNPVPGQSVSLTATGSNNILTQPAAPTDSDGVTVGTIASTMAEAKTITATVGVDALSEQPSVSFIGDAANISATLSTVTATPTNLQANGTSATTVAVTVRDINGNPVPDQVVGFTATGTNNVVVPSGVPTSQAGFCWGTLASIAPETKTIAVTVNPGAGAIGLSDSPSVTFVGDLIARGDVRLCYGEGVSDQASVQTWDDSISFWSAISTSASANATIDWTVGKFRPFGDFEYVLGILSDDGVGSNLDLMRWNGDTWSLDWSSTAIAAANANKRGFDIEHEATSGDGLVVYANDTSNPVYRTRSAGVWSPESNVFVTPPGVGSVLWVELVGRPGTDEIALVFASDDSRLHAVIWTGESWDELDTETTLSATMSTVTESKAFDATYEHSSGDLLVVWGHQYSVEEVQYATKPAGSTTWSTTTLASARARAKVVRLAADPGSDRVAAVLTEGNGDDDTVGMIWDGWSWVAISELDSSSAVDDRDAAIAWVGATGQAVLVYHDQDGGADVDWARWTPYGGWNTGSDASVAGMGDIEAVQLLPFGDQDKLMLVLSDSFSNLFALTFDGSAWSVTNLGLPLVSDVSSLDSEPFTFSIW